MAAPTVERGRSAPAYRNCSLCYKLRTGERITLGYCPSCLRDLVTIAESVIKANRAAHG